MRNIIGPPVVGDDLYGRDYELARLWEHLENGEHLLMLAPRRVGKTSLMLDLKQAPRENWDVIPVDVEGGRGPEDCVSELRDVCRGDPSRVSSKTINRCFTERLAGESGTPHLDHYETRLEIALDEQEHGMAHAILRVASKSRDGVRLADLKRLGRDSEQTFMSVLPVLEADGYLRRKGSHLAFRSNLLREWWRKRHGRGSGP